MNQKELRKAYIKSQFIVDVTLNILIVLGTIMAVSAFVIVLHKI